MFTNSVFYELLEKCHNWDNDAPHLCILYEKSNKNFNSLQIIAQNSLLPSTQNGIKQQPQHKLKEKVYLIKL